MSERNFARYFPHRAPHQDPLAEVELGLVKLKPGVNPAAARDTLAHGLPDDVLVLTKEEYVQQEMRFWQRSSPIGFIFGLGTGIGFVVGIVICYQILSTDIADHLAEFATLKAIGYHNHYLTRLVLQQALFLSLFGFLPGLAVSALLYALLAGFTGLPMEVTLGRVGFILILTVVMCIISGSIAVRKVQTADPAEVF
jgi:putative ABC transport system permease protein